MRVGIVEYINALPLYFGKTTPEDILFIFDKPTALSEMLREGDIDAALTSTTEYFSGEYILLPNFCIAAHKEILSVNLYHKGLLDGAKIGLTDHSSTSIALLKVLCHHFWKISPNFVSLDRNETYDSYDGFLLIGDEALQQTQIEGFQTIDLAHAWYEATHLPFVFAVFVASADTNSTLLTSLQSFLDKTLRWNEINTEAVEKEAFNLSGLPIGLIRHYYQLCRYRLGKKELESLEQFKELYENVPLLIS